MASAAKTYAFLINSGNVNSSPGHYLTRLIAPSVEPVVKYSQSHEHVGMRVDLVP